MTLAFNICLTNKISDFEIFYCQIIIQKIKMSYIRKAAQVKYRVVFVRHGESEFNKLNRFTGW